jgi:hypothetical protein
LKVHIHSLLTPLYSVQATITMQFNYSTKNFLIQFQHSPHLVILQLFQEHVSIHCLTPFINHCPQDSKMLVK